MGEVVSSDQSCSDGADIRNALILHADEAGPPCYGLGGTEPTVSDACVALNRLNPNYFLAGEMTLDREAAE